MILHYVTPEIVKNTDSTVTLSAENIGPKTEKPKKTKIVIIGLSLLRNDVDCRHFKDAAPKVGLPAGPGR